LNVYLNDRVVPAAEARVSVFDHGFLYGDGVYETLRVYESVPFLFDEHMDRLERSADLVALSLPLDREAVRAALGETLRANGLTDAAVRISVTRGPGALGIDPLLCERPTFVIFAEPRRPLPPEAYEEGVRVAIAKVRRNHPASLDPRIKSHNFLNNILARIEADRALYHEVVLRNLEGQLTEGTVSNLFFVEEGVLCTPSVQAGILDGITRETVIRLARSAGLKVKEGRFRPGNLEGADEAFLSSSLQEIVPVTGMNNETIGTGRVGAWTKKLMSAYRQYVAAYVKERTSA